MKKVLITIVGVLIALPTVANAAIYSSNVGDGGSGLPACNSSTWGMIAYGVNGHNWKCPYGGNHFIIIG